MRLTLRGFLYLIEDYAFDTKEAAADKVRELLRDPDYRLAFGQALPESNPNEGVS